MDRNVPGINLFIKIIHVGSIQNFNISQKWTIFSEIPPTRRKIHFQVVYIGTDKFSASRINCVIRLLTRSRCATVTLTYK